MTGLRYYARSASDNTDDRLLWFISDRQQAGLNVTTCLVPCLRGYLPFLPREMAEKVARGANKADGGAP